MILASKSPRRKEILENLGCKIVVKIKEIEEISDKESIVDQIIDIAYKKCSEIAIGNEKEYVLAADTVVVVDNEIMGKPKDKEEAFNMLQKLSGKRHQVISAYAFLNIEENIDIRSYDITEVEFRELDEKRIKWYIGTKEPMDKAGAYGIQGKGALLVKRINGDFFNVMGFPVSKFVADLEKENISLEKLLKI